jgi:uncharacterized protein
LNRYWTGAVIGKLKPLRENARPFPTPILMPRLITVRRSPIHGTGVFAARPIPKGTEIIEYRGARITHDAADERYAEDNGHTFLFTLNDTYVVDANVGGNSARWINHSCDPNCEPQIVESREKDPARDRIVIEARRNIRAGEELTYDYGIVPEERLTPTLKKLWACRCGAKRCTGTLLKPKR